MSRNTFTAAEYSVYEEIKQMYLRQDFESCVEETCPSRYLAEVVTETDIENFALVYENKCDMDTDQNSLMRRIVEDFFAEEVLCEEADRWGDYPVVVGITNGSDNDIEGYLGHLMLNGYNFIRVTDRMLLVDEEELSYTLTCAEDRRLRTLHEAYMGHPPYGAPYLSSAVDDCAYALTGVPSLAEAKGEQTSLFALLTKVSEVEK